MSQLISDDEQPEPKGRPNAACEILGRRLRWLRESRRVSIKAAADAIAASPSKISRIETGRTRISVADLHELLTFYQLADRRERQALQEFASRLAPGQWWDDRSSALDDWFRSYLVVESIAKHIRTYEVRYVPGLLQTPAYAEAIVRLHPSSPEKIQRRIEVRLKRQRMLLDREDPPSLWAVVEQAALDGAALPDGVASPDVMREQIQFLIEVAQQPTVKIQVLTPGVSMRLGIDNSFSLLRLRSDNLPDVAYLEHIGDAIFLDDPIRADRYRQAMDNLGIAANTPDRSIEILQAALDSMPGDSTATPRR